MFVGEADATTQSNNIEKMLSIACARSVNMNVVPSKEGNGGFTIEEEEERGGGEMTTRRDNADTFFGGDANRSDFVRGARGMRLICRVECTR